MAQFGSRSLKHKRTLHPALQRVLERAIKIYDFSILEGHRGKEKQDKAFSEGRSKLKFPQSKHNKKPSLAVDVAPYPINWEDMKRFFFLAGVIMSAAKEEGVTLRWGHDWDKDMDFNDQSFNDAPHFELA